MKPCKCGCRNLKVSAVYAANDYITVSEDGEDFEVTDTHIGDGEWDDGSWVTCQDCYISMPYDEWSDRWDEDIHTPNQCPVSAPR